MAGTTSNPVVEVEAMFEPTRDVLPVETQENKAPMPFVEVLGSRGVSFGEVSVEDETSILHKGRTPSAIEETSITRNSVPSDTFVDDASSRAAPSISVQSMYKAAQHRFGVKTFRTPAACCVCRKSIMSVLLKTKAFHCEQCGVDCCADCHLQVDVKLPCGSYSAQEAVARVIQNKLSVDKIMRVVAPVVKPKQEEVVQSGNTTRVGSESSIGESMGIGTLSLQFIQAFALGKPCRPDSDLNVLLRKNNITFVTGDYYMRVTAIESGDTARTHMIQNSGRPKFEPEEFLLNV